MQISQGGNYIAIDGRLYGRDHCGNTPPSPTLPKLTELLFTKVHPTPYKPCCAIGQHGGHNAEALKKT